MRERSRLFLVFLLLTPLLSNAVEQPPQLLGTWYGQYLIETEGKSEKAEMWMEISHQLDKDGWKVRGHNRWNVLDEPGEQAFGAHSLGRKHEYYDTVSGVIDRDGRTIRFTQEHHPGDIDAILTAPGTMELTFSLAGGAPNIAVTIERIGAHYQPGDINVLGIDVSHHSGKVDWQRVMQQGYGFAYVKSSEGVDYSDNMFETHWKSLREIGMPRGAYHFYVTKDDPVEQAKFFASHLKDDLGTLLPAVDVEVLGHDTDKKTMTETLLVFLRAFEKELNIKPIIYTSSNFWDAHYSPEFTAYPLWMAEYGVRMPRVPFGWKQWLVWQRKSDHPVEGVERSADINLLHPDAGLESLKPGVE